MDLAKVKKLHDAAYIGGQDTRQQAADDAVFYYLDQWGAGFEDAQLSYRGVFDLLRKACRQILADLDLNPVQVDFSAKGETPPTTVELVDGLYRREDKTNSSLEAYKTAREAAIIGGFGAWGLRTKYVSDNLGETQQIIERYPIQEANNTVFWDPNSKRVDKSDAMYVSVLHSYTDDGYTALVKELKRKESDNQLELPKSSGKPVSISSFGAPEESYTFPWIRTGQEALHYVVDFYYRKKVKTTLYFLRNLLGDSLVISKDEFKEGGDELLATGYQIEKEEKVKKWEVIKYVASGEDILIKEKIAGEYIPIIPVFGAIHTFVEGSIYYEGAVRPAKDAQRLRNFEMSYLMDIVATSPRAKPIFSREQVAGYEHMYSTTGMENRFDILFQNLKGLDGELLPVGPIATLPDQPIPPALEMAIRLSREAVEDVANPGLPKNVADPDISGKAVLALQSRLDMQSVPFQENYKHAKRWDAQVWAKMAGVVYDVPRTESIVTPSGVEKEVQILLQTYDEDTNKIITLNDLRNSEFNITSKIGPSYQTQKDQIVDKLKEIMVSMDPTSPLRHILTLQILASTDGIEYGDIKKYALKQLVLSGVRAPETPEEVQLLKSTQEQSQQPSPEMVLAKAEESKAKADIMGLEVQKQKIVLDSKIRMYQAETARIKALTEAEKAKVVIPKTQVETTGLQLDNLQKTQDIRI